jgi:large subunit ribosomal protein L9
MKVLLIKDVKNVGKKGEVKDVKEGYGNNFLIAKGFAKLATTAVIRQYEAEQKRKKQQEEQELERLKNLAKKLENTTITIAKKIGANGSLFGAITKDEIAHSLKEFDIDKKMVEIKNPIKATGLYEIKIKLGHSLHPEVKVEIVGE